MGSRKRTIKYVYRKHPVLSFLLIIGVITSFVSPSHFIHDNFTPNNSTIDAKGEYTLRPVCEDKAGGDVLYLTIEQGEASVQQQMTAGDTLRYNELNIKFRSCIEGETTGPNLKVEYISWFPPSIRNPVTFFTEVASALTV